MLETSVFHFRITSYLNSHCSIPLTTLHHFLHHLHRLHHCSSLKSVLTPRLKPCNYRVLQFFPGHQSCHYVHERHDLTLEPYVSSHPSDKVLVDLLLPLVLNLVIIVFLVSFPVINHVITVLTLMLFTLTNTFIVRLTLLHIMLQGRILNDRQTLSPLMTRYRLTPFPIIIQYRLTPSPLII